MEAMDSASFLSECMRLVRDTASAEELSQLAPSLPEEKDIQIEFLKAQLFRRNKVLAEQRAAYLKELLLLREQLYKKHRGEAPVDWGHYFDYGNAKYDFGTSDESAPQQNVVSFPQHMKKADWLLEAKKMRTQFEYELKKQENQFVTQLRARDKQLAEIRASAERMHEQNIELQARLEQAKRNEQEAIEKRLFAEKQRQDIVKSTMQHKSQLQLREEQTMERALSFIENEDILKAKIELLERNLREKIDLKDSELRIKDTMIEELKQKLSVALRDKIMDVGRDLKRQDSLNSIKESKDTSKSSQAHKQTQTESKQKDAQDELETLRAANKDLQAKLKMAEERLLGRSNSRNGLNRRSPKFSRRNRDSQKSAADFQFTKKEELVSKLKDVQAQIQQKSDPSNRSDHAEETLLQRLKDAESALREQLKYIEKNAMDAQVLLEKMEETEKELDSLTSSSEARNGKRRPVSASATVRQRFPMGSTYLHPPSPGVLADREPKLSHNVQNQSTSFSVPKLPPQLQNNSMNQSTNSTNQQTSDQMSQQANSTNQQVGQINQTGSSTNQQTSDISKQTNSTEQQTADASQQGSSNNQTGLNNQQANLTSQQTDVKNQQTHQQANTNNQQATQQTGQISQANSSQQQAYLHAQQPNSTSQLVDSTTQQTGQSVNLQDGTAASTSGSQPEANNALAGNGGSEEVSYIRSRRPSIQFKWNSSTLRMSSVMNNSRSDNTNNTSNGASTEGGMDAKELEQERTKTERLLREARVEIERLELENHSLRQLLFGSYRSHFKPENNQPVIEHEEPAAPAAEKVVEEGKKSLPRVNSTPAATYNHHVQSPDEQAAKKAYKQQQISYAMKLNDDWIAKLSVWERLRYRALLLQQKLKYTIEHLDGQHRQKAERLMAEQKLLSPKYNKQVFDKYHPEGVETYPLYALLREGMDIASEAPSEEELYLMKRIGTKPSITGIRSVNALLDADDHHVTLKWNEHEEQESELPPNSLVTLAKVRPKSADPAALRRRNSRREEEILYSARKPQRKKLQQTRPQSRSATAILPQTEKFKRKFSMPDDVKEPAPLGASTPIHIPRVLVKTRSISEEVDVK